MSRKYIRRFICYHPGLFQDKKLFLVMYSYQDMIDLDQFSRLIVRYRKARSSDYLLLQLELIAKLLRIDFNEILALNRVNETF